MKKIIQCIALLSFMGAGKSTALSKPGEDDKLPEPPFCGFYSSRVILARILNGQKAGENEFPWIAALSLYDIKSATPGQSYCTGSLINPRWILTAAHCLIKPIKYAILGNNKEALIDKSISHPLYRGEFHFDIALVRLKSPIEYNEHIQPICLPLNPIEIKTGAIATTAGWGIYEEPNIDTTYLRTTILKIVAPSDCYKFYRRYNYTFRNTHQICAGDKYSSACNGDSGAPLMLQTTDEQIYQIGIVTFGRAECTVLKKYELPNVFENVYSSIQWISETIKKS